VSCSDGSTLMIAEAVQLATGPPYVPGSGRAQRSGDVGHSGMQIVPSTLELPPVARRKISTDRKRTGSRGGIYRSTCTLVNDDPSE
jgi:hypothetical protein